MGVPAVDDLAEVAAHPAGEGFDPDGGGDVMDEVDQQDHVDDRQHHGEVDRQVRDERGGQVVVGGAARSSSAERMVRSTRRV